MVVDARGYQLGFDPSPITNSIGGLVQQTILDRLGRKAATGDEAALSQLATRDPRAAQAIGGILMGREEQQLKQKEAEQKALQERQKISYAIARGYKSATNKPRFLLAAARELEQLKQPEMAQEMLRRAELYATDPGALEQEADAIIGMNAAPDNGEVFAPTPAYDEQGNPVFIQSSKTGTVAKIPGYRPFKATPEEETSAFLTRKQGEGIIAVNTERGKGEVQIEQAPRLAGGKEAGQTAITQSNKAIDSLGTVRSNLATVGDAIQAIDDGAESGVIASKLPSLRKSSIELDNTRKRLGLGVIQGTTFGALSEGELALALDVAIPSGLQPQDLKSWLVRRRDAQTKLADELENAAIYLGTPGNTPAGYLEMRRNQTGKTSVGTPLKAPAAASTGSSESTAPGGVQEGATATNPQTGQKIIFRGGQWQAM